MLLLTAVRGDGFSLVLPARWKEVQLGIPGALASYETDTDVFVVMRATGSAPVTPDSYGGQRVDVDRVVVAREARATSRTQPSRTRYARTSGASSRSETRR